MIKDEDIFVLAARNGGVPGGSRNGFGLYHHDCRYLNQYELRIAGTTLTPLVAVADEGAIAHFELTNQELDLGHDTKIPAQSITISLTRVVDASADAVHDSISIANHTMEICEFALSAAFNAGFEDIFEIRGLHPSKIGREQPPQWSRGVLIFRYAGADGVARRLQVEFEPEARPCGETGAEFPLVLKPGESKDLKITLRVSESRQSKAPESTIPNSADGAIRDIQRRNREWSAGLAKVHSNRREMDEVLDRCFRDLHILRSRLNRLHYFAAGLPWYGALFGRDSIIAALQTLAFNPGIAGETIRLLAQQQASEADAFTDAEPGKILHELRRGELANLREIPQAPYYGSVDATPLFLILAGEHANWTGDLSVFREVRGPVERALAWIDDNCRRHGGYLSYETKSGKGLGNQGWKDSGESIMNEDGSLARPPIALAEVQGYVYAAKLLIANLYAHSGEQAAADRLRAGAADLKARFHRDFWIESRGLYALALQKGGKPAVVLASNQGQAMWTGIIEESRAEAVCQGLMSAEMFSGWGVRTLSDREVRYNPVGYHLGTVWPHDNSIIAAGLRRYRRDEEAAAIFEGILGAAHHFENYRLPEVFAGFSKDRSAVPVRYPVACHPQAWAAGSIPFMLTNLLGLRAEALDGRLRVVHPVLPERVTHLELRGLRVGRGSVDLRFTRSRDGAVTAEVTRRSGDLEVQQERSAPSRSRFGADRPAPAQNRARK